jgi:hypothetical protein
VKEGEEEGYVMSIIPGMGRRGYIAMEESSIPIEV